MCKLNKIAITSRQLAKKTKRDHVSVRKSISLLNDDYKKNGMPLIRMELFGSNKQRFEEYHLTTIQLIDYMSYSNNKFRFQINRRLASFIEDDNLLSEI